MTFGSWVMFQPEDINTCAQAMIRTLQADEHQQTGWKTRDDLKAQHSAETIRADRQQLLAELRTQLANLEEPTGAAKLTDAIAELEAAIGTEGQAP